MSSRGVAMILTDVHRLIFTAVTLRTQRNSIPS
jgi:hypothetical protein